MDLLQSIAALGAKMSGQFRSLLEVVMTRFDPKRVQIFYMGCNSGTKVSWYTPCVIQSNRKWRLKAILLLKGTT